MYAAGVALCVFPSRPPRPPVAVHLCADARADGGVAEGRHALGDVRVDVVVRAARGLRQIQEALIRVERLGEHLDAEHLAHRAARRRLERAELEAVYGDCVGHDVQRTPEGRFERRDCSVGVAAPSVPEHVRERERAAGTRRRSPRWRGAGRRRLSRSTMRPTIHRQPRRRGACGLCATGAFLCLIANERSVPPRGPRPMPKRPPTDYPPALADSSTAAFLEDREVPRCASAPPTSASLAGPTRAARSTSTSRPSSSARARARICGSRTRPSRASTCASRFMPTEFICATRGARTGRT